MNGYYRFSIAVFAAVTVLAITPAHAVKLYKWVDENGSTHYHQTPPPKGTQFVEEKEFDGQTNVVPSPETEAAIDRERQAAEQETTAEGDADAAEKKKDEDSAESKSLTPEELTAIAEEAEKPVPLDQKPGGAEPASGGEGATPGVAGSGATGATGAESASGATGAPGATPVPVPPTATPAVVPGP